VVVVVVVKVNRLLVVGKFAARIFKVKFLNILNNEILLQF